MELKDPKTMLRYFKRETGIFPDHHKKPIYMTSYVCDVEFRREIIYSGSSLYTRGVRVPLR